MSKIICEVCGKTELTEEEIEFGRKQTIQRKVCYWCKLAYWESLCRKFTEELAGEKPDPTTFGRTEEEVEEGIARRACDKATRDLFTDAADETAQEDAPAVIEETEKKGCDCKAVTCTARIDDANPYDVMKVLKVNEAGEILGNAPDGSGSLVPWTKQEIKDFMLKHGYDPTVHAGKVIIPTTEIVVKGKTDENFLKLSIAMEFDSKERLALEAFMKQVYRDLIKIITLQSCSSYTQALLSKLEMDSSTNPLQGGM